MEDIIMPIDILNIANCRSDSSEKNSFLIAMPAFAIECEVHPPLENELDVYEETVLKFISINFSRNTIANALNISETFIEEIYANLEIEQFIQKTAGNPWIITERGANYLKGIVKDRPSDQALFGYFFINAIKKDVLPFFYNGNLEHAPLYKKWGNDSFPTKILIEKSEDNTFQNVKVKNSDLKTALSRFIKCSNILKSRDNDEISFEEAKSEIATLDSLEDQFDDLDSFDEIENDIDYTSEGHFKNEEENIKRNQLVRKLSTPPKKVYLTMQITIDPSIPEGYRVSSPFNLRGMDERYYHRQLQWLKAQPSVYLEETCLGSYLNNEIVKLCKDFNKSQLNFDNFALAHMPNLHSCKEKFLSVYDTLSYCYGAMQRNPSPQEQKHIIRDLGDEVVEKLLNLFFTTYDWRKLNQIKEKAEKDLEKQGRTKFLTSLLSKTLLSERNISWNENFINNALKHLPKTYGFSALEKMANLLIVNFYNSTANIKSFLEADNASKMFEYGSELNRIRNLASHNDEKKKLNYSDYLTYKDNIFTFADGIIAALGRN
jgi:hypothetical protein